MGILLTVDNFEGEGSGNVPPPKTKNEIKTFVTVPDGKTIVLGGLTIQNDSTSVDKIPLLGDLPFIGPLFQQ